MTPEIMKTRIRIRGDVDAGPARRLGVAADRVDVPAEVVRLATNVQDEQLADDEQQRERHAAVLVAGSDGEERDRRDDDEPSATSRAGSRIAMPCRRPESAAPSVPPTYAALTTTADDPAGPCR